MKLSIHFFSRLLIIAVFLIQSASAIASVKVGAKAPEFSLTNAEGKAVSLSEFKDKYVILEWTNHQCPFVKKHYDSGNMQSLQKKYTDQDVVWLSIISSAKGKQGHIDNKTAKKLTHDRKASPSYVLFDESGDVGRQYGAKTTPHMYIVDPKGTLKYAGAIDSIPSVSSNDIPKSDNYVDLAMTALFAGKKVDTAVTRPYGCSVKY